MKRVLPLLLIVCLLIAFRVVGSLYPETLPNFQPLAAVFFCGAMLASGWRGLAIPLGVWAVTFPLGFGHTANPLDFVSTLAAFVSIFFLGKSLSGQKLPALLIGSAVSALFFHLVTCGAAWITDPLYAKSLEGLYQSVWAGPLGSKVPSWIFLRNMAAANVLFTAIFVLARLKWTVPHAVLAQPRPAMAKSR